MSDYLSVLVRRQQKWSQLLQKKDNIVGRSAQVKRYIRKGIPGAHRGKVSKLFSILQKLTTYILFCYCIVFCV